MLQVIERSRTHEGDTPQAVEATLNYIVDTGEQIFTQTAEPGSLDVRTGGQLDPRRVTIRNGRASTERFVLEQEGFQFLRHDTKVTDFFNDEEVRRVLLPGGRRSREIRDWRRADICIRSHVAHGR